VGAEVVHFAGHGEIDPRHPGTGGIYLEDGTAVHPLLFTSSVLGTRHRPFVFFNACMVGTGGELLGDCGGFPGECLTGGFRGLVAPLWAVRDTLAKEIALEFYQRTLDDGQPVADVLHRIRARYRDPSQPAHRSRRISRTCSTGIPPWRSPADPQEDQMPSVELTGSGTPIALGPATRMRAPGVTGTAELALPAAPGARGAACRPPRWSGRWRRRTCAWCARSIWR
jgi:hypothetical protein